MLDGGTKDYDEVEDEDEQEVAAKEHLPFLIMPRENVVTKHFSLYRLRQLTGEFVKECKSLWLVLPKKSPLPSIKTKRKPIVT